MSAQARFCGRCGAPRVSEDDLYCRSCGKPYCQPSLAVPGEAPQSAGEIVAIRHAENRGEPPAPSSPQEFGTRGGVNRAAKLPVLRLAGQAIRLPFEQVAEFAKFGSFPALASWLAALMLALPGYSRLRELLLAAIFAILVVPFSVAWTKLAADGPGAVANRRAVVFGRTEVLWLELEAAFLLFLGLLIGAFLTFLAAVPHLVPPSEVLIVLLIVAIAVSEVVSVRFSFVLPSAALEDRPGFGASWRSTRGSFWRLEALFVLLTLPYAFLQLLQQILSLLRTAGTPLALLVVLELARSVAEVFLNAWMAGALAAAYRFKNSKAAASLALSPPARVLRR